MGRLTAIILTMLAGAASASDWRYGSLDNGAWFEAHVVHSSDEMSFNCGGPSPGGLPLPQSDEPLITAAYSIDVALNQPQLGGGGNAEVPPPKDNIVVVTESGGFRLPGAEYDVLHQRGWVQPVAMGDALVAEIFRTAALAVDLGATRLALYNTEGLGPALERLVAFCDARWAATSVPLPASAVTLINGIRELRVDITPTPMVQDTAPAATPQVQRADDGLWQAVQSHILRSCDGAVSQYMEGYALAANLDGDGVQDYVIFWDAIQCAGQMPRPYCGASQCAVDVFASSVYAPGTRPETIFAAAVTVVPWSDGRDLIQIAGRLALCHQPDAPPDCLFLWGWANGELTRVN